MITVRKCEQSLPVTPSFLKAENPRKTRSHDVREGSWFPLETSCFAVTRAISFLPISQGFSHSHAHETLKILRGPRRAISHPRKTITSPRHPRKLYKSLSKDINHQTHTGEIFKEGDFILSQRSPGMRKQGDGVLVGHLPQLRRRFHPIPEKLKDEDQGDEGLGGCLQLRRRFLYPRSLRMKSRGMGVLVGVFLNVWHELGSLTHLCFNPSSATSWSYDLG